MTDLTFRYLLIVASAGASIFVGVMTVIVSLRVTKLNIKNAQKTLDKQLISQTEILENQMKVQLATTIHKEWISNVRECIAKMIEVYLLCKDAKVKFTGVNFQASEEYNSFKNQFVQFHIRLSLYLDFTDQEEYHLYDKLIGKLWTMFVMGEKDNEASQIIIDIQNYTQSIFWTKTNPVNLNRFIPSETKN